MIILDTHIWIWLINGDERVANPSLLEQIYNSARNNDIYVPAICLWEVAMIASKKRISLNEDTLNWLKKASAAPGLSIYPFTP